MGLKAPVYAGRITGLGDARYFAGMGVRWLGIQTDPTQPGYLSADRFREISGWVSGPEFVLETDTASYAVDYKVLAAQYGPALFCIGLHQAANALEQGITFGLRIRGDEVDEAIKFDPKWIIISDSVSTAAANKISTRGYTLLCQGEWTPEQAHALISEIPGAGFAITGSPEMQPGLKNYEAGPLLESLEDE